jgi:hypothetical protein
MIRIDEIYCNTFLPKIQENPHGVMHWFDPFGSVAFENLCNHPHINHGQDTESYLFWDQEPLHTTTVAQTLSTFNQIYPKGRHHLITSERNSEFVEQTCDTYGFIPHYYFFHGWAALDWYRGYDRSFMLPRARYRAPTTTFMSPNRIISGMRDHRVLFLYHVFKKNLSHNHISAPRACAYSGIDIAQVAQRYMSTYPDINAVFDQADLPKFFLGESQQEMTSYCLGNWHEAADSLVYVPTETVYFGRRQHLTEKTFKAIALEMPFILVAPAGSLEYLKSYGFQTFGGIWDESYDNETDPVRRVEKVTQLLKDLDSMDLQERQRIHNLCVPIVEHNHAHFYSGAFEKILWKELTGLIRDF